MDAREPIVRDAPHPYARMAWPDGPAIQLPVAPPLKGWAPRRSERALDPPNLSQLGAVLWHTARCQATLPGFDGATLQQRPVPSAGAIHPIHLWCEWPDRRGWARYDPATHTLVGLPDAWGLAQVREMARAFLGNSNGLLLACVAEPGLTHMKYQHADSLVWRDAGIVQGALSLVAPALGLGTCLLGLTAQAVIAPLGQQGQLVGVGTLALGVPR